MEFGLNSALFIHIGALFYIIAFLIRDELRLRLMVLIGSVFYLLYYFIYPESPLWDAIVTSVVLTLANVYILFLILLERSTFALDDDEKRLFEAFEGFSPGQFRQMLKIAEWQTAPDKVQLTMEQQPLSRLYYIFEGAVQAQKGKHSFPVESGNFIGEIAFVLKGLPTATIVAPLNTRYVEWNSDKIRQLMDKSPAFENAMIALLSRDLADKLATSVQPEQIIP